MEIRFIKYKETSPKNAFICSSDIFSLFKNLLSSLNAPEVHYWMQENQIEIVESKHLPEKTVICNPTLFELIKEPNAEVESSQP